MFSVKASVGIWVLVFLLWVALFVICKRTFGGPLAVNTVVRVVDGDTVVLNRSGKHVTCRLIGVNAPESVHPKKAPEPYGFESSQYLKWWIEGKTVRVDYEYPQGSPYRHDRYGRLLVYLWADKGRQMVNLVMVQKGYARFDPGYRTKYRAQFFAAQKEAQEYGLGLWVVPH